MRPVAWRPITGCSFASPGCANCAALAEAAADVVRVNARGRAWTGVTRLSAADLPAPARLAEPATVYVCPHGDLFHEATPDVWIAAVFAVMEAQPRHRFMVLTKRAERQRAFLARRYGGGLGAPPHIRIGVSAERQAELDRRGAALLETRAAAKYLTLYPLLGPVDLSAVLAGLRFVQAGEEAQRPADPAWFAAIARQCRAAGVPFSRGDLLPAAPHPSSEAVAH